MAFNVDYLNYEYGFKILVLGDSGVGKTCLVRRFVHDLFQPNHTLTLCVEVETKFEVIDGCRTKLTIFDTAGTESANELLLGSHYRRAAVVLVVYDVTRQSSLDSVHRWMALIRKRCHNDIPTILVGNKADRSADRRVPYSEGEDIALHHGLSFLETSAHTPTSPSHGPLPDAFLEPCRRQLARVRSQPWSLGDLVAMGTSLGRLHPRFDEFQLEGIPRNIHREREEEKARRRKRCCSVS